jgi:hypothetical protein
MGKSLMHDPERAPLVRRAFKDYATGLISEELFHRVQAILWGRVPSTALRKRAHPDFPLRGFGRCELCGRGLTGSKGHGVSCFEVALRERAA